MVLSGFGKKEKKLDGAITAKEAVALCLRYA
jgi:hypothetical protein